MSSVGLLPLRPVSREWGYDRGRPVDRYYIESFLAQHTEDIHGRVLEIGDNEYTQRFGGDRVSRSDVLHVEEGNPAATFVGDLTRADDLPSGAFDCVILTQTLHLIYDVPAALTTVRRILTPGGVLLATVPGITRISHEEWPGSWFWSFTSFSVRRLFAETFALDNVHVESHGNVLAASAFLYGLGQADLTHKALDFRDPDYEVVVAVRAEKSNKQSIDEARVRHDNTAT